MPGASYKTVTDDARPGRILLAELQGLAVGPPDAAQLHRRLRVAHELTRSAAAPESRIVTRNQDHGRRLLQRLVRRAT